MVVTGSANCSPLALSTTTTLALIIRFRYIAEITRFSISMKLRIEIIISRVRSAQVDINRNLYPEISQSFYPAREGLRSPLSAFSAALLISDA